MRLKKGERSYRGGEEVNIHLFAGVVQTNTADSKHTNTAGISLTHRLISQHSPWVMSELVSQPMQIKSWWEHRCVSVFSSSYWTLPHMAATLIHTQTVMLGETHSLDVEHSLTHIHTALKHTSSVENHMQASTLGIAFLKCASVLIPLWFTECIFFVIWVELSLHSSCDQNVIQQLQEAINNQAACLMGV